MYAFLILSAIVSAFAFVGGVVVGLAYERSLRPSRLRDLDAAVSRFLDADAAICRPRAGFVERREYASARRHMANLTGWEAPVPSSSGFLRARATRGEEERAS
jgi:hypothetical protein